MQDSQILWILCRSCLHGTLMDFLVKRNYLENVSGFESCGKYAWRNFIYITSKEPKKRTKRLKNIWAEFSQISMFGSHKKKDFTKQSLLCIKSKVKIIVKKLLFALLKSLYRANDLSWVIDNICLDLSPHSS